jgi:hypothetical protein
MPRALKRPGQARTVDLLAVDGDGHVRITGEAVVGRAGGVTQGSRTARGDRRGAGGRGGAGGRALRGLEMIQYSLIYIAACSCFH